MIKIGVFIFGLLVLASCVNDLEKITKITSNPNSPDNVTQNLELFYKDSGHAKIQVFAKLAETYSKPESIMKLKKGVKVNFFTDNGKISSTLTALYGEINYTTGIIFVRDSVRLFNLEKNQTLETEELSWNQKDSTIYTERDVIVRKETGVLYGCGVKTNQSFSSYEFLKPYGKKDPSKATDK